MDLNSLNSGTTDSKGWLNPVVGTITADTSIAQNIYRKSPTGLISRVGGTVYNASIGATSPTFTIGSGFTDVSILGTIAPVIPTSSLQIGNAFEVYMAGYFTDATPAAGSITFYPSFMSDTPLGNNYMSQVLVLFEDVGGTNDSFEWRLTFRVVAFTDTTTTFQTSYTSSSGGSTAPRSRTMTDVGPTPTITLSRDANQLFQFRVWSGGTAGGPYTLTRTQYYFRQLY